MGHLNWMNKSLMDNVMGKLCTSSYEVGSWNIAPAVAQGENFTSQLRRVEVLLTKHILSFIVKCPPEGDLGRAVLEAGIWAKETAVYTRTLPVLHDLLGCNLAPELLACGPMGEIVLNDIRPRGYSTIQRTIQLDYEHCLIAIEVIAKFHAASVVAMETGEGEVEFAGKEVLYCDRSASQMTPYLTATFTCLAEEVRTWPGCEKYADKIRLMSIDIFDQLKEAAKPSDYFNVLNHGDLWANNIMFKHDKAGRVKKAKLIDFQNCRWTSPAHDLQYFIVTSMEGRLRNTKLDQLLTVYIRILNDQLSALGSQQKLTLEILKIELRRTAVYGLYAAASTLAIKMADAESPVELEDPADFNSTDKDKNPFVKAMRGRQYRVIMSEILAYFEEQGVFS